MTRRHITTTGFSLIELLVVVGIVSLLIALLLPALTSARETARSIQCASTGRQVGLVMQVYVRDNGVLPKGRAAPDAEDTAAYTVPTDVRWTYQLVTQYQLAGDLFLCPTREYEGSASNDPELWKNWQSSLSYNAIDVYSGWNLWTRPAYGLTYDSGLNTEPIDRVTNPSRTILFAEVNYLSDVHAYMSVTPSAAAHMIMPIHNDGWTANIVFADGHVASPRADARGFAGRSTYYAADRFGNKYLDNNAWTIDGKPVP